MRDVDAGAISHFDAIWRGWARGPDPAAIAQRERGRARFLATLERWLRVSRSPLVLEIGCGSAIDLAILGRRAPGARLVGLDLSAEALVVARGFLEPVGRFLLCRGDAFALPFADRSFGLVFSQGVLEHFLDAAPIVREQIRVLADDGALVISVPQRYTGYTAHKRRAIRHGMWPWGWEGEFSSRELAALGRTQGLECREIFGEQYWRSWAEPVWVLRDLWGKLHRRNPLAATPPFPSLARAWDGAWTRIEHRWGHWFLQNVVGVFVRRRPA